MTNKPYLKFGDLPDDAKIILDPESIPSLFTLYDLEQFKTMERFQGNPDFGDYYSVADHSLAVTTFDLSQDGEDYIGLHDKLEALSLAEMLDGDVPPWQQKLMDMIMVLHAKSPDLSIYELMERKFPLPPLAEQTTMAGKTATLALIDEMFDELPEPTDDTWEPNNRKARRAAASKQRKDR